MTTFQLGIIPDEVSQDFEEALRFAKSHDLTCVELRSAWEKNPFELTREDIRRIKALSRQYDLPVVAISSPFYKCDFFDEDLKKQQLAQFARLVDYAGILGAKAIRCFDFYRDPRITHRDIAAAYEAPIALCEKAGLQILIESEPAANSYNCETLSKLISYINSPTVKALYDPGNNIYADGEVPYPDGFRFIKDQFTHIHIKDAVIEKGKAKGCPVGKGLVDYHGLFRALLQMQYSGPVILETHYKPDGALSEALLRDPKGSAISRMGDIASAECLAGLREIIKQANEGS